MLLAECDLESFAGAKNEVMKFHFKGQFAFQNEEELASMKVGMSSLAGARGHELFDDAEVWCPDQVPAVAVHSPLVMLGRSGADGSCRHRILARTRVASP
jgi:hypothetical protein